MKANGGGIDAAYRTLFEANPHPMWVFDRATLRFLAVNDAAVRQYGYTHEEFLERSITDIRPEEDAALVAASVGVSSASKIWRHRRKDGSTLLAEVTAHSLDFMGVEARLVLALDVTARERGAEQLRRTNRTLQAVLEAAPVGVLVLDGAGRIIETNEAARELLGARGLDPLEPALSNVLRGEGMACNEVEVADGRWAELSVRSVALGPGSNGAVAVLSECTEKHSREGRLQRELERLESRVRERGEELRATLEEMDAFVFSVSHDLRGPLRAVDGFAQVVMNDPAVVLGEESRDALRRVRRAARRMGELIDGILVLSRLARAEFVPRIIDLSAMVDRAARNLERAHPERALRFQVAPGLRALGDPRHVAPLVDALLDNAVKFTVGRDPATIEFFETGEGWAIRDDGVGFDMAYAGRLFKPFERLHPASEHPGHGLGLAVVERIVRRHGGTIRGESRPGEGATFHFSLGPLGKA